MEITANKDFSEWAVGYSGCDGGNISGSIWFCGIELGGGDAEGNLLFEPVTTPPFIGDNDREKFKTNQYNWKVLKLYSTILGGGPAVYKRISEETRAFYKSSDTFKMNLYPIAFHNESNELWEEWHFRKTGLPTKPLYQAWCQLNRFPSIMNWVFENSPKAIICTGTTYLREFLMAFSGPENIFSQINEVPLDGRYLFWKKINQDKTILFITPFLGQGGLKSDAQIEAHGLKVKSICEQHFNKMWCKHIKL